MNALSELARALDLDISASFSISSISASGGTSSTCDTWTRPSLMRTMPPSLPLRTLMASGSTRTFGLRVKASNIFLRSNLLFLLISYWGRPYSTYRCMRRASLLVSLMTSVDQA